MGVGADIRFTVFVDNLPYYVDHRWLRKVFQWYGRVLTSFVSRKRREGRSTNFGFISFGRRYEAVTAIRNVNRAFVGEHRMLVKMALYGRSEQIVAANENVEKQEELKSYADVVRGGKGFSETRSNEEELRKKTCTKELTETLLNNNGLESHREIFKAEKVNEEWLEKCMVGYVREIELINGLQNAFYQEGVFDIKVAAMGGSLVLLQFESVEDKRCYTEGNAAWLSGWFEKLVEWNPYLECNERIIWLSIKGIPLHAWEVQNFRKIGERFGDVIAIDEHTSNKKILDYGRVLISTKLFEPIDKELILEVNSSNFLIHVKEEIGVRFSVHSNPVYEIVKAPSTSSTQPGNSVEDSASKLNGIHDFVSKDKSNDAEKIVGVEDEEVDGMAMRTFQVDHNDSLEGNMKSGEGLSYRDLRKKTDEVGSDHLVSDDVDPVEGLGMDFPAPFPSCLDAESRGDFCLKPAADPMLVNGSPELVESGNNAAFLSGNASPLKMQEELEAPGATPTFSAGPNVVDPTLDHDVNYLGLTNSEDNDFVGTKSLDLERDYNILEGNNSRIVRKKTKFSGINYLVYGNKRRIYEDLIAKNKRGKDRKRKGKQKGLIKKGMKECINSLYSFNEDCSGDNISNGEDVSDAAFNNGNRLFTEKESNDNRLVRGRAEEAWDIGLKLGIECPEGKDATMELITQYLVNIKSGHGQ